VQGLFGGVGVGHHEVERSRCAHVGEVVALGGVPALVPAVDPAVTPGHPGSENLWRGLHQDREGNQVGELRTGRVDTVHDDDGGRLAARQVRHEPDARLPVVRVPARRPPCEQRLQGLAAQAPPIDAALSVVRHRSSVPLRRGVAGVEIVAVDDDSLDLCRDVGGEPGLPGAAVPVDGDQQGIGALIEKSPDLPDDLAHGGDAGIGHDGRV
jgi:hypothetical protein